MFCVFSKVRYKKNMFSTLIKTIIVLLIKHFWLKSSRNFWPQNSGSFEPNYILPKTFKLHNHSVVKLPEKLRT